MPFRFPIKDVNIKIAKVKTTLEDPVYENHFTRLNQHEFVLDIDGVAWFYARNGDYIEIMTYPGSHANTVELYLNGSVYGAILHQRKILSLHGSCFIYQGLGIMICGESGVGKSSLTASFCLNGAEFLTDDVSPIIFEKGKAYIWGISDRIKLWSDSLQQLNQKKDDFDRIVPKQEKYYFPMESVRGNLYPVKHIFVLHLHEESEVRIQELNGVEKFTTLRNEVYRKEFLSGMSQSETEYLKQLVLMSQTVTVTKLYRPAHIPIEQLRNELKKHILEIESDSKKVITKCIL